MTIVLILKNIRFGKKFAGDQRWEEGLLIGTSLILSTGGPQRFLAARPTLQRRFLIEQLICFEVWGESLESHKRDPMDVDCGPDLPMRSVLLRSTTTPIM
jgi:hypothetical protein